MGLRGRAQRAELEREGHRRRKAERVHQLPITNYQSPTTNYQLRTTNYQLPTATDPFPPRLRFPDRSAGEDGVDGGEFFGAEAGVLDGGDAVLDLGDLARADEGGGDAGVA